MARPADSGTRRSEGTGSGDELKQGERGGSSPTAAPLTGSARPKPYDSLPPGLPSAHRGFGSLPTGVRFTYGFGVEHSVRIGFD
ncbi:hypothetical protein GCM10010377_55390 [Streptomyces viridiviolaceus]|nr:hypothetical protein GCM10010377_55390 [Streptomyces viridiviolaceus]